MDAGLPPTEEERRWPPVYAGEEEGGASRENKRRQSGVAEKMRCAARGVDCGKKMLLVNWDCGFFIFMWTPPYGLDIVEDEIAKDY